METGYHTMKAMYEKPSSDFSDLYAEHEEEDDQDWAACIKKFNADFEVLKRQAS
jgi:hypothetical protein